MHQARIGYSGAVVFCFLFNFLSNLTHFHFTIFKMCQLWDIRQKSRLFRILGLRGKAGAGHCLLVFQWIETPKRVFSCNLVYSGV